MNGRMALPALKTVELPDFGMPEAAPEIPATVYEARITAARRRMADRGFDRLIVYADREHSANLAYLTGFDPRFEEALLILDKDSEPAILVGNECFGLAGSVPVPLRRHLFQDFSLPGQPRGDSATLDEVFVSEGVGPGRRVGVIGWKYYDDRRTVEIPAFIVDTLRQLVGVGGAVENAAPLMIDAADGLRVVNEVEQLAAFEYAACQTSNGVKQLLFGLKPGMSERQAVRLLDWNGTPLSCHLMLSSGERASLGLVSPSDRTIERGDQFTVAFGVWGALNCRAGFVVEDAGELPEAIRDYVDRLVVPYFAAVADWYAALRIGVTGSDIQAIVDRRLGNPFFGVSLNAGHQIHLDEWVNSPIFNGSTIQLRSGMALQCDIIPATGTEYFTTNIEDGVALADEALRNELAHEFPAAWTRIERRRAFMREVIGIGLDPAVLPLSNIPAYLPPFLLRPDRVMTVRARDTIN